ncbi:MAG: hypothetical protein HWE12_11675 [Oceanospirillaceae bacterium]|nr:hypothetical protein [Oceanospirillaceae bacterium]
MTDTKNFVNQIAEDDNTTVANNEEGATKTTTLETKSVASSLFNMQVDSDEQQECFSPVGIPSESETIQIGDRKITLPTLLVRRRDLEGNFSHEEYFPIAKNIAVPKGATIKNVDYCQAYSDQIGNFLLPVKSDGSGRPNAYNLTLRKITETERQPFSLGRVPGRGGYVATRDQFTDMQKFEFMPFETLLEKAFDGKVIDSADHPILKELNS